jgi:signal transduction histidine kinase
MSAVASTHRLRTRLFLSYVAVVVAGALAMVVVATVLTRTEYDRRLGGLGLGRTQGRQSGVSESQLTDALDRSLVPALLAGVAVALVVAAIVALVVGGRLLRPIDELGAATRRMAAGDYATPVTRPAETELASLADDVNRLGEHLASTEQRRTQLLADVTHELRTPITVIRGQAEGLIDGIVTPSDEAFAAIADEASRLERIVDDLTLLSRADEGTLDIDLVDLDLSAVAESAAERLRPQFDYADVRLVVEAWTTPLRVRGDGDRLTQVLSNLLGNALGHTPSGGAVTVRAGRDGQTAFVDVADTGPGVSPEEAGRIFERFHRGPVTGAARPGRGIGLTIARSLARAHGGDVTLVAGSGPGATFRLTVPIAESVVGG